MIKMIIHKLTILEYLFENDCINYEHYTYLLTLSKERLGEVLDMICDDSTDWMFEGYLSYVRM